MDALFWCFFVKQLNKSGRKHSPLALVKKNTPVHLLLRAVSCNNHFIAALNLLAYLCVIFPHC